MQINILERKFYLFKQTHNFKKSYAIKLDKFDILSFSLQILGKNRSNEVPSIIKKISKEMCSKFYDSDAYISIESPLVPHLPQFNTSVSHQNPSIQHQKPLSSTHPSDKKQLYTSGVELRGFLCGTERFQVLKRCGPCVEPMC